PPVGALPMSRFSTFEWSILVPPQPAIASGTSARSSVALRGNVRFHRVLDRVGEVVGALARRAQCQRHEHLAEAVALEDVEELELRAAIGGLQVVAALRNRDRVLRQLGPADLVRRFELRDLELALGLDPRVLDGAGVD